MEQLLISQRTRWLNWAWLIALYLAGVFLWGYFLSWGRFTLDFHDWAHITGPRLAFLRDALIQGLPPLHSSDSDPSEEITDRFLSVPDQILSPQIILLRFIPAGSLGRFVVGNVLLLYSLGYAGLLVIRRTFSLPVIPFTILFLLFNFNGHILAHFAVGHATWGGYFLFPWFAILVFRLVDGERGWTWIAKMALLMFAIFLQGSFHQFIWALIFLGLLALAKREYFLTAGGGVLFAGLISLVRLLPPVILLDQFDNEFMSGYPTLVDLWQSMVVIYPTDMKLSTPWMGTSLGSWEFSLYIGLAGAVFLLYFGVWRWLSLHNVHTGFQSLALPVLGLVVLSIGRIYEMLRLMPIPLLDGERVSSRLISLPFVFILIFAVIYFKDWLDRLHRYQIPVYVLIGSALIINLNDLWQNYRIWQVVRVARNLKKVDFDPRAWTVANHPDPAYLELVLAGIILSLVSLGVLLFFTWRSRRRVK